MITPAVVQATAEQAGTVLNKKPATKLAGHVEKRMRSIIQDATRFMRHAHRRKLCTSDIESALRLSNFGPLYGFVSNDAAALCVGGDQIPDVFYHKDPVVNFDKLLRGAAAGSTGGAGVGALPAVPAEPTLCVHWLAVHGVQPETPQNPAKRTEDEEAGEGGGGGCGGGDRMGAGGKGKGKGKRLQVEVQPRLKHVLGKEQQVYYKAVTEAVLQGTVANDAALQSVARAAGLQQLVPYLCAFLTTHVHASLGNCELLLRLLRLAEVLLISPHLSLEPYLQQLLPVLLTCALAHSLGHTPHDHWHVRAGAARLTGRLVDRFGPKYPSLRRRVAGVAARALTAASSPLPTRYGGIKVVQALGAPACRALLLPQLEMHAALLQSERQAATAAMRDGGKNDKGEKSARKAAAAAVQLLEANHCLEALAQAAATAAPSLTTPTADADEDGDADWPPPPPMEVAEGGQGEAKRRKTAKTENLPLEALGERMLLYPVPGKRVLSPSFSAALSYLPASLSRLTLFLFALF